MIDSIALAKSLELQNESRQALWSRDEDAFYEQYGAEAPILFAWLGRLLDRLQASIAHEKADRSDDGRSAFNDLDCSGQAACARK